MQLCHYPHSQVFIYYLHILQYYVKIMDFIDWSNQEHPPEVFYKKDVFKQLANFTEKIYVGVSFLIKLQTSGLQQKCIL